MVERVRRDAVGPGRHGPPARRVSWRGHGTGRDHPSWLPAGAQCTARTQAIRAAMNERPPTIDPPSAVQLVELVENFLESEAAPGQPDPKLRYRIRVAANLLR